MDRTAQQMIIETIQKEFPEHRFVAEEEGADALGNPNSPYEWIIDPLDGTMNFTRGKESFGTIVAVRNGEEFLAGVMILPMLQWTFEAAKGMGATYNGKPIQLRKTASVHEAVLCSNLKQNRGEDGLFHVEFPICADMQNCGCAAAEIGEILRGKNDGLLFNGPKLWDIAAGCLMLQEAGGQYRFEHVEPGNNRSSVKAVLSTKEIFAELEKFVFNPASKTKTDSANLG